MMSIVVNVVLAVLLGAQSKLLFNNRPLTRSDRFLGWVCAAASLANVFVVMLRVMLLGLR